MKSANCKQTLKSAHPRRLSGLAASNPCALELNLPTPDEHARARSHALALQLQDEIAHDGPMPFSRYMDRVLYTPELGYYCADTAKFGGTGDFLTAPEISPLFARCLAHLITDVLRELNADEVLEIGAGSGIMAADLLQALEKGGRPVRRYTIVEPSAALRRLQENTLAARVPSLAERVLWRDRLPKTGFRGVMLANEVLDALPASRFRIMQDGVQEWHVGWESQRLAWTLACPTDPLVEQTVAAIQRDLDEPLPQGYDSEVNLRHTPWVQALAQRLTAGLILLIDYGYGRREYYHPQRNTGTLVCYYRHRAHDDPLLFPGLQDISVHVDFTTIAEAAAATGLEIAGFTTQASFLLATGLTELLAEASTDCAEYHTWTRQAKQLILPGEMGELIKVMALTRRLSAPLQRFGWRDLRNRL
jgi:SAM-dependent MidA family methyltransferase